MHELSHSSKSLRPKISKIRENPLILSAWPGCPKLTAGLTSTQMPTYTMNTCPCCFCQEYSICQVTESWNHRRLALGGDIEITQCHCMAMWRCVKIQQAGQRGCWAQRKNTWIVALPTNTLLTSFYRLENWGLSRWNYFFKVIEGVSCRARTQTDTFPPNFQQFWCFKNF